MDRLLRPGVPTLLSGRLWSFCCLLLATAMPHERRNSDYRSALAFIDQLSPDQGILLSRDAAAADGGGFGGSRGLWGRIFLQ
jgi:hypothetical protein